MVEEVTIQKYFVKQKIVVKNNMQEVYVKSIMNIIENINYLGRRYRYGEISGDRRWKRNQ